VDSARKGDWSEVYEVAKNNKGIILGVFLPLAVALRWPAAVFAVAR
jgi:hypothetical protein